MAIVVLPDNTVLVKLAHVNRVPLLAHIGNAQTWCYTVSVECAKSARAPGLSNLTQASTVFGAPLTPTGAERTDANMFRDQMTAEEDRHLPGKNHGEAETIAIILRRGMLPDCFFLTDDQGAAAFARANGIKAIDTWTVIRLLHKKGHLNEPDAWNDCNHLRSIGEGWPPCGYTRSEFTAWLTR